MKNDFRVREFVAVLLTALAGIAVAILHGMANFPALREQTRLLDPREAEWVQMPVIMESCCVFFSTIYFTGRFLAQRLLGTGVAETFHTQGRNHMRLLHVMSGTIVVLRQTLMRSSGQPFTWGNLGSLALGLTFVVLAAFQRNMPDWRTLFPPAS